MKKVIFCFLVIVICVRLVNLTFAQEKPLPKKKAAQTSPPKPPPLAPEAAPSPVPRPALPAAAELSVMPAPKPVRVEQPATVETADRKTSWQAVPSAPSALVRKEVVKVNYIDAGEAMVILQSYKSPRGRIQRQRNRNTLIIEDTPEFMDKLLSILKELDVRPLDLMFTVEVIMGSMQEEPGETLSGSDALVKELKSLLKYKHFSRLDTTMIKIQDNGRSAQRMGGQGIGLLLELYPRHIKDGKNDAFQVELSLRQTTKRIPIRQNSTGGVKILRYEAVDLEKNLTLLQTSLSLKDGEHSVVGVSKLNGGDTALILIIEGKVIK